MSAPKSYSYKNISGQEQFIVGIGRVGVGETITTPEPFDNPNLEFVKEPTKAAAKNNTNDEQED